VGSSKITFFSKPVKFSIYFTQFCKFRGGGQFQKACRSRKKESKPLEIKFKPSELARTISKIEKRREFVRRLCLEQSPKNSFRRLYTLEGLLVLVEKASFQKNFDVRFIALQRVIDSVESARKCIVRAILGVCQ